MACSFYFKKKERDFMAIYVTGDIHGGIDIQKLSKKNLKKKDIELTDKDYVIILGDFGLPFFDKEVNERKGEYSYWINWLSKKPCTILWVDGNHDNFNYWEKQPVAEWNGGKVQIHPKAPNVIHLMRGEIYEIEGKTFFAFGGAASHDKEYRKPDISWWKQETASQSEIDNALENLNNYYNKVDYVLTHTPPSDIVRKYIIADYQDRTAEFLTEIEHKIDYKAWFCGHVHMDISFLTQKLFIRYKSIMNINEVQKMVQGYCRNPLL